MSWSRDWVLGDIPGQWQRISPDGLRLLLGYPRPVRETRQWRSAWDDWGMDLDDMTPVGGGTLCQPAALPKRDPVARFTLTRPASGRDLGAVHAADRYDSRRGPGRSVRLLPAGPIDRARTRRPGRADRDAHRAVRFHLRGDDRQDRLPAPTRAETATSIQAPLRPGATQG